MNNFEKIEKAVSFIEKNLKEDIHLDSVAEEACCSKFHFHRMFQMYTGETIFDYIRKRRLTEAADEILNSGKKIWIIAGEFQFNSPEAFSRSFKKAFGISPFEYRKNNKRQIYSGQVILSKERLEHYNSKIILEPSFKKLGKTELAGRKLAVNKYNINDLVDTWHDIKALKKTTSRNSDLSIYEIHLYITGPDHYIHHDENCTFHKIVSTNKSSLKNIPSDFITFSIPEGNYAVFRHVGTRLNAFLTVDYIWATWMMKNDIELDDRYAFEYYGKEYFGPYNENSIIEYYLPIK